MNHNFNEQSTKFKDVILISTLRACEQGGHMRHATATVNREWQKLRYFDYILRLMTFMQHKLLIITPITTDIGVIGLESHVGSHYRHQHTSPERVFIKRVAMRKSLWSDERRHLRIRILGKARKVVGAAWALHRGRTILSGSNKLVFFMSPLSFQQVTVPWILNPWRLRNASLAAFGVVALVWEYFGGFAVSECFTESCWIYRASNSAVDTLLSYTYNSHRNQKFCNIVGHSQSKIRSLADLSCPCWMREHAKTLEYQWSVHSCDPKVAVSLLPPVVSTNSFWDSPVRIWARCLVSWSTHWRLRHTML